MQPKTIKSKKNDIFENVRRPHCCCCFKGRRPIIFLMEDDLKKHNAT